MLSVAESIAFFHTLEKLDKGGVSREQLLMDIFEAGIEYAGKVYSLEGGA